MSQKIWEFRNKKGSFLDQYVRDSSENLRASLRYVAKTLKEFKALGVKAPLQNRTDSEIETTNKTRSIDAKALEKKDSEANLQATVTRLWPEKERNWLQCEFFGQRSRVTFLRSWNMPMPLFQRVTYLDESPSPYDRWRWCWTASIYREECSRQHGHGYRGLQAETDLNS